MSNKILPTPREFLNSRRFYNINQLTNQEDEPIKITDLLEDYAYIKCKALREENKRLKQALENIVCPIRYMESKLEDGDTLNGYWAAKLSEDHFYLKKIAKQALEGG